jgi:hypothetical protein
MSGSLPVKPASTCHEPLQTCRGRAQLAEWVKPVSQEVKPVVDTGQAPGFRSSSASGFSPG